MIRLKISINYMKTIFAFIWYSVIWEIKDFPFRFRLVLLQLSIGYSLDEEKLRTERERDFVSAGNLYSRYSFSGRNHYRPIRPIWDTRKQKSSIVWPTGISRRASAVPCSHVARPGWTGYNGSQTGGVGRRGHHKVLHKVAKHVLRCPRGQLNSLGQRWMHIKLISAIRKGQHDLINTLHGILRGYQALEVPP